MKNLEEYNEGGNNGEEVNNEDENENNGINGEEDENNEGQIMERDSLKKTMTQQIGEDVIQIAEHPNKVYYDTENFCDYKP